MHGMRMSVCVLRIYNKQTFVVALFFASNLLLFCVLCLHLANSAANVCTLLAGWLLFLSLSPYSCLFFIRRLYSINYKLMSIAKAMSSQQTILNKLKSLRRFLLWKFATIRFYYSSFFKRKHCVQLDEHLVNYGKITKNFYWRFSAFQFVYFTNTSTERTNTKYEAILA